MSSRARAESEVEEIQLIPQMLFNLLLFVAFFAFSSSFATPTTSFARGGALNAGRERTYIMIKVRRRD